MAENNSGINTLCVHAGDLEDQQFKGAISPLFMSTSYPFEGVEVKRYPRYFNTPNQVALAKKMAALEHGEAALIFGSGMAAVSSSEYLLISAPSRVAALKICTAAGMGSSYGRHPPRMRSSKCLASVWSAMTFPSSSRYTR